MTAVDESASESAFRRGSARHLPGEEGTWVFIFGDLTLFAVFFCTYLYYRSENPALFGASQLALKQSYGAINTLLLLTSSLFVAVGLRAIRRKLTSIAPLCFVGAFACGLGFLTLKVLEYHDKIRHHITPATNDFFMYFYTLTGLHVFHIIVGMSVLAVLGMKSRKPELTIKEFAFVEGGACFWHMVDLLWIILFPLLYFMK